MSGNGTATQIRWRNALVINHTTVKTVIVKSYYGPGGDYCCEKMNNAFNSILKEGLPLSCPYCNEEITVEEIDREVNK